MDVVEPNNPPNRKSSWSIVLGFLLILGFCFFIGNVVLALLALLGGLTLEEGLDIFAAISDPAMRPFIKTGIGLNHLIIFTGTSLLFAFWLKQKDWLKYFYTERIDASLLFSFIFLLICAYPLIGYSATLFEGVEWASEIDESSMKDLMTMLQMDSFMDLFVNLIIVALLPAIGEELLFRGVLQKELVARIENYHIAIVIAAIIFSGVHLQIQGFLPKFIIGLILGYAYYWTKSIWYPMILHFINNGMQTVILFLVGDQMETLQEESIKPEMLQLIIVVIFSCFLCLIIVFNIRKRMEELKNIKF